MLQWSAARRDGGEATRLEAVAGEVDRRHRDVDLCSRRFAASSYTSTPWTMKVMMLQCSIQGSRTGQPGRSTSYSRSDVPRLGRLASKGAVMVIPGF
jgi:hypothetical protein